MINLINLRKSVRRATGQDELDLEDPDLDLLLNITYWEIQEKFHIRETESSTIFLANAGQREYLLPPSFESLRIAAITDPTNGQHTKLERISIKEYEDIYNQDVESRGTPTKYFRGDNSIILWKTPDQEYTITIHYRTKLDDLSDATPDPQLPRSWQEMLKAGAIYRAFYENSDYDKGNKAKAHYIQLIQSAVPVESKEEWDSSTAGVQPLGIDY